MTSVCRDSRGSVLGHHFPSCRTSHHSFSRHRAADGRPLTGIRNTYRRDFWPREQNKSKQDYNLTVVIITKDNPVPRTSFCYVFSLQCQHLDFYREKNIYNSTQEELTLNLEECFWTDQSGEFPLTSTPHFLQRQLRPLMQLDQLQVDLLYILIISIF